MNLDRIRALVRLVEENDVDEIEVRAWGRSVRVVKRSAAPAPPSPAPAAAPGPAPEPAPEPEEEPSAHHRVESPMVGTFYRAPSPEAPSFVEVGDTVRPGQTLCILEAMKLMNELQSEVAGTVRKILVENGEPVEYGQPLFEIETS